MVKTKGEIAKIREEALAHLKAHEGDLAKFAQKADDQDAKWQKELALLERRVQINAKEIRIGEEGETISIRISLSDYEVGEIARLDGLRLKLDPEKDIDKISQITYIILATITTNPLMTAQWFADNRMKYSTEDMLSVTLSYFESMNARAKRVAEIQEFR